MGKKKKMFDTTTMFYVEKLGIVANYAQLTHCISKRRERQREGWG